MKIAYIGIDLFFPVLKELFNLGCKIEEIFTCQTDNITEFNTSIIAFAKKNDIPFSTTCITADDINRLKKKGCCMAVCGGYYYRIPVDEDFPIVNIHPSLLPLGRGSWPMPVSILRKEEKSGVTVHKIAEGFDTGDILLQRSFLLAKDENLETFMDKANKYACEMMRDLIANFHNLWDNAIPQGEGEYIDAPTEEEWTVREDMTVAEADLILRAFYGYECIYLGKGEKYVILYGRAVKGVDVKALPLKDGFVISDRILKEI